MLLSAASSLYGFIAGRRRRWYSRPERQRRLRQPVISVGNLSVGGSGKTPVVAHLAQLLLASGERPAILSRGYGRRVAPPGVTVVSDGERVLAGVDQAGDEPLMLARMLPGVPVVVARERYAAGRHAEVHFRTTVHLLDDGFQHLQLARDINLLLVSDGDLTDRVLPAGRLREPLAAAAAADAILVPAESRLADDGGPAAAAFRDRWRPSTPGAIFRVSRVLDPVRRWPSGEVVPPRGAGPILAVTGIARPERMFADLTAAGWEIGGTLAFADHHRFAPADIARIAAAARTAGASLVVTTAKDGVRLEALDLGGLPLAIAPVSSTIEPRAGFAQWLAEGLARARRQRRASGDEGAGGVSPRGSTEPAP